MSSSQYISVRETAQLLAINEKKVMELIENRELQAYRIANKFLRLKKSEVQALRNTGDVTVDHEILEYNLGDRIRDFLYFNDFYIFSVIVLAVLLYIIFYT